jgi:hypothetical protein
MSKMDTSTGTGAAVSEKAIRQGDVEQTVQDPLSAREALLPLQALDGSGGEAWEHHKGKAAWFSELKSGLVFTR